jgi:BMFP domain-containing protein YqiC
MSTSCWNKSGEKRIKEELQSVKYELNKAMKNLVGLALLSLSLVVMVSCRDKEAEKRIAQLESRIAELEGKGSGVSTAPQTTASTPETKPEGPLPVFEFETLEHDFGTINEGDVVEYTYKFKNTGEAPLIIQGAQGSCGCTVPDWSKEPIPPGGEGFVTAKFDSKGKPNIQNKTVTVTANTWPKQTVLRFKAMVVPASNTK